VDYLQSSFSVSERRACRVVQQHRTSQRHLPEKADEDMALSQRMVELSRENPRYGYLRVWALLRREGWAVNKKRAQRLWREVDLKVPQKQHKRRRIAGSGENSVTKKRAEYPGHVWGYDFAMDSTEDGRRLKMMPVVEEYIRECLALPTQRSITSEQVIQTLAYLFAERGAPDYIRSDNVPEFIAEAVKAWLADSGVKTLYIEPGSPWENAYSETFISRMRDELLNREVFANVAEAKVLTGDYREHYNRHRPHGALSYMSPAEFAAAEAQRAQDPDLAEQLQSVSGLPL
jgi:putative transposase